MGMDQKVAFPKDSMPTWQEVVDLCAQRGVPIQMRMIDGELAFPDETPPQDWRELRIGTAAGMVTMRREADGITLVIWGNADEKMREAWNAIAQALETLTGERPA